MKHCYKDTAIVRLHSLPFQEQLPQNIRTCQSPTTTKTQTASKGHELVRPFLAATGKAIDNLKVLGDSDCLFRALAKQLSGSPDKNSWS